MSIACCCVLVRVGACWCVSGLVRVGVLVGWCVLLRVLRGMWCVVRACVERASECV